VSRKFIFKSFSINLNFSSFSFGTYEERSNRAVEFRGAEITVVIDGSEQQCSIPCTKKIEQTFYSGKKKKHSITLLAAVSPRDGYIYWISDSY
jgi:hypothetical protein